MSRNDKKKNKGLIGPIAIIILIIFAFIYIKTLGFTWNKEGEVSTISEATLMDIIDISDLSTVEYTYNSVVTVKDEEKSVDKYYVSYKGMIKAGVDFSKIKINIDDKEKLIHIIIPKPQIQDVNVDIESLDFIFTKNKYENETVIEEAYRYSMEDLKNKGKDEEKIYDLAYDNSKNAIIALVEPWISTLDDGYELVVE